MNDLDFNELELRCLRFAKNVRDFCKALKQDVINVVYLRQVIRSSSSVGANYIEANENLGKQDLLMKPKISRKEAKETIYFLELLMTEDDKTREQLRQEGQELRKIFSTIINKINQK